MRSNDLVNKLLTALSMMSNDCVACYGLEGSCFAASVFKSGIRNLKSKMDQFNESNVRAGVRS